MEKLTWISLLQMNNTLQKHWIRTVSLLFHKAITHRGRNYFVQSYLKRAIQPNYFFLNFLTMKIFTYVILTWNFFSKNLLLFSKFCIKFFRVFPGLPTLLNLKPLRFFIRIILVNNVISKRDVLIFTDKLLIRNKQKIILAFVNKNSFTHSQPIISGSF